MTAVVVMGTDVALDMHDVVVDVVEGETITSVWKDGGIRSSRRKVSGGYDIRESSNAAGDGLQNSDDHNHAGELYNVEIGTGVMREIFVRPNSTVADLKVAVLHSTRAELASMRTDIVEMKLEGASLFPTDRLNTLINPGETIHIVWGFGFEVLASENVKVKAALYHDSTCYDLITSARNLAVHEPRQSRRAVVERV